MNQAQQMNEFLGEAGKGLGSFEGKLEELGNDLNTVISGFTAVGKGIMKTGKGNSKTAALIKSTIEDLRRSEVFIERLRLNAASSSETLGEGEAVGKMKLKPGDKVQVSDHRVGTRTGTASGVIGKNVSGKVWSIDLQSYFVIFDKSGEREWVKTTNLKKV